MYKFCWLLIYQDILYMSITKSKYVTNYKKKKPPEVTDIIYFHNTISHNLN